MLQTVVKLSLSYEMRAPDFGPPAKVLYEAALDQSEWADRLGFGSVVLSEHHASPDGYMPSPLVMASAIGARTKRLRIMISLILLPFYHPQRLAEDAAVCDLVCGGRLDLMFGAGYREEEFEMYGVDIHQRGRTMSEGIDFLKKAWTGEPFEFQGRKVQILPRPAQQPRPRIVLGGASPASARRAARIADAYAPIAPRLYEIYLEELEKLDKPIPVGGDPGLAQGTAVVAVSDDPERTWNAIERNLLHDAAAYGAWTSGRRGSMFAQIGSPEQLKASGQYLVLTPQECLSRAVNSASLRFRPLVGGIDPDVAWESLQLFETRVLPYLDVDGPPA
jgi:alkanesulfonate monooxygenase SsuD/methylene tetrahydromethanopterin reductase-like flavin-dependent oxidoreductase (luciferase family)